MLRHALQLYFAIDRPTPKPVCAALFLSFHVIFFHFSVFLLLSHIHISFPYPSYFYIIHSYYGLYLFGVSIFLFSFSPPFHRLSLYLSFSLLACLLDFGSALACLFFLPLVFLGLCRSICLSRIPLSISF